MLSKIKGRPAKRQRDSTSDPPFLPICFSLTSYTNTVIYSGKGPRESSERGAESSPNKEHQRSLAKKSGADKVPLSVNKLEMSFALAVPPSATKRGVRRCTENKDNCIHSKD